LQIVRAIEGLYPKTKGLGDPNFTNQDENLRIQLVPFANEVLRELERSRRWRLNWKTAQQVTSQGSAVYQMPVDYSTVKRIWYTTATGGIKTLRLADENEIRLVKGDSSSSIPPQGAPLLWAQQPPVPGGAGGLVAAPIQQFNIWPAPDFNGPTSGNYTLNIDYYSEFPQIIEVTASWAGGMPNNQFQSAGAYLLAQGLPASPTDEFHFFTIRSAGNPIGVTALGNDDYTNYYSSISGSNVNAGSTLIGSGFTNAQCFFNSANWIIRSFPKVMLFGMLREVVSYLYADQKYQIWEQRYQKELEMLDEWENDAQHGVEILAGAVAGQLQPQFRDIDLPTLYEIRGA